MDKGALGKEYEAGTVIVRQGETGDCMFVVQEGQVAATIEQDGQESMLGLLGPGDFFGEMCVFEKQPRGATVRALTNARVLTVDKKGLLRQITVDPTLAFNLLEKMSARIRTLNSQVAWMDGEQNLRK
ncbi:MAG: cyclic nucleotide-binding domain-containing protein [Anaerolineae bacterium]|nr:cyclic nucleotide-binding domain-containing protein [Anaerolineae bacterium]